METAGLIDSLAHFDKARDSAEQGFRQDTGARFRDALTSLRGRAEGLARLATESQHIEKALSHDSKRPLGLGQCLAAKRKFEGLSEPEPGRSRALTDRQWFDGLPDLERNQLRAALDRRWSQLVDNAVNHLRERIKQLPKDADPAERLSLWLSILILTPEDIAAEIEVGSLLSTTVTNFRKEVTEVTHDVNAYRARHAHGTLRDKGTLGQQIEDDQALQQRLVDLQPAVELCVWHQPKYQSFYNDLAGLESDLDGWLKRLKDFNGAIARVRFQADTALRTGNFADAREALALSDTTLAEKRATDGHFGIHFKGFSSHPTFQWLEAYVSRQEGRRRAEERRCQHFEWWVELQGVAEVSEIESLPVLMQLREKYDQALPPLREWWRDFESELKRLALNGRTPIEGTYDLLQETAQADRRCLECGDRPAPPNAPTDRPVCVNPDCENYGREVIRGYRDPTGLQGALIYQNPADNQVSRGRTEIIQRIEPIVAQIENLRAWLGQFRQPSHLELVRLGGRGVVNWSVERKEIERMLYKGKLHEARERCQAVLGADDDAGLVDGLWPLQRAQRELEAPTDESLKGQADLRDPTREEFIQQFKKDVEAGRMLSAPALRLYQKRKEWIEQLENNIKECKELETTIRERIKKVQAAWDKLTETLDSALKPWFPWFGENNRRRRLAEAVYGYARLCSADEKFLRLWREHRAEVNTAIQSAWNEHPELFKTMDGLRQQYHEVDEHYRDLDELMSTFPPSPSSRP